MSITTRLKSIFGDDVILMAFKNLQKGPRSQGWQNTTTDDITSEDIKSINSGSANCGILLTGRLGCIDLDSDVAEAQFLESNPDLRQAFAVKGLKGRKLFVRWHDGYPQGQKITDNEIEIAELLGKRKNATVAGIHPEGMQYREVGGDVIPEIEFEDINWPRGWDTAKIISAEKAKAQDSTRRLIKRYGNPYKLRVNDDGIETVKSIQDRFWAALFNEENAFAFLPEQGTFWIYLENDGLFHRITNESLREKIADRLFRAAEDERKPELRDLVTTRKLDGIVEALKGIAEHRGYFDDRPFALHVGNGAVLRSDGDIVFKSEYSPAYKTRNRSPFDYKDGDKCPRFLKDLLCPMLNDDDVDLFRRWLGMTLYGRNVGQQILLLDGTPGRGKGVLSRIIRELVGIQNCAELRTAHLGERFETNRYIGKTLLVGSDVPGNFLEMKWASMLKSLTGGDLFTVEAKGLNDVTDIVGEFNVLIVSNSRLRCRLDGDDGAWRRRLLILRTEAPEVQKKIPDLDRILLNEEGDGILKWAIEGFADAMDELDQHGSLRRTNGQAKRVEDLLAESAALECFIRDDVIKSQGWDLSVDEIEKAFAEFCADRGWQAPRISKIHGELPDLMLKYHGATKHNGCKRVGKSVRGFSSVRLREGLQ